MIRGSLVVLAALTALPAFSDDWRDRGRDRWERRDNRDYRDSRSFGNGISIVDRTISDLRRVASRNRVDGHERNHFERALHHLNRFRYNWSRDRDFDSDRLNDAIEHIDDLSRAHQIHPRDRQLLARDLRDLREFRSRRGSFGRW